MSKKVAFIIGGLRGGGAEKVCVTLANGLADRGYEIDLVVLSLNGAIRDKELSPKVNLVNLGVGHARYSALALWRYLRSNKPRTVLSFNRQISVVLGLVRNFVGLKFRLVSRNINFLSIAESSKKGLWHGFISKRLIRRFYALSDLIVSQSHVMKDDLISYLKVPEDRVVVIHNPVCQKVADCAKAQDLSAIEKKDYLLCVGRLEEQKAFHFALSAFAAVAPNYPDLRLKIVGKGSLESQLKEQARALGVVDRVDFEGYQTDMIPYYLGANATLLTSLYEGFPNVLVESIALGTPVVAFDCPSGPSEIVVDGVNGYLIEYKNVNGFADGLVKILNIQLDSELIKSSADKYSLDKIIALYEAVITNG